jgi:hypothetical protein
MYNIYVYDDRGIKVGVGMVIWQTQNFAANLFDPLQKGML